MPNGKRCCKFCHNAQFLRALLHKLNSSRVTWQCVCAACACVVECVCGSMCVCVQHNFLYRQAHTHTPHGAEHCLLWLLANKTSRKVIHCIKETRRDESRQNETRRDATRPPTRETRLNIVMFRVDKGNGNTRDRHTHSPRLLRLFFSLPEATAISIKKKI